MRLVTKMKHTLVCLLCICCLSFTVHAQKYADLYAQGKYAKAFKAAEKAIDANSKDLSALLTKAMCYIHLYQDPETNADYPSGPSSAVSSWQSIKRKDKSGDFQAAHQAEKDTILWEAYELAVNWHEKGQVKRAKLLLEDLLEIDPAPEYYYLLGRIAEQEALHGLAVQHFNDAAAKVYVDATKGIKPQPDQYLMFADLADAVAEDDDFMSALVIYARGIRLFQSKEISDRCYALVSAALETRLPGFDTVFSMTIVRFLDTIPTGVVDARRFYELKWAGIQHQYAVDAQWHTYDMYTRDPEQRLLQFACADAETTVLDQFLEEMQAYTAVQMRSSGIYVSRLPIKLTYWMQGYTCMYHKSAAEAEAALFARFDEALTKGDYNWAAALLFNLNGLDISQSTLQAAEKKLFAGLLQMDQVQLNTVDLYAMSLMFPKNASGKKLQKDESTRLISQLLEKKDYSRAAEKLRIQMKIDPNDAMLKSLYKQWLVEDFIDHYIHSATYIDLDVWNGTTENCTPGTLPDSVHKKVLERLNYVRRLAGVPDNCTFDADLNKKCQAAALMMRANGDLSHMPPRDWLCWTTDGATGAGNSNLSLGYGGSEALIGQVEDDGGNNQSVGHRRWILYPDRKVFGHGSTPGSMALWALGGSGSMQSEDVRERYENAYISWPAQYYFPATMLPYRWSLSNNSADFSDASVEMYCNNKRVPLEQLEVDGGYGSPTMVWEPDLSNYDLSKEVTFKVVVKKVEMDARWDEAAQKYQGVYEDYSYWVTIIPFH